MKKLRYLFALLLACVAMSCTEAFEPHTGDDDDEPVVIGQPSKPN